MKRLITMMSVFFAVSLASGADNHESLADESIKLMDKLTARLKEVTDKASGEKAMPGIKELAKEMQETKRKVMALPPLNSDEKRVMETKFKPKMEAATAALKKEFTRISENVPGGKDYAREVSKLCSEASKEVKDKK